MEQVLDSLESEQVKTRFFTKLSETIVGKYVGYWYPLREIRAEIDVIAFEADFLEDEQILYCIRDIFARHGITNVCVISELDNVYYSNSFLEDIVWEDEDGYEFPYFSEQYTFDESHEWLIYKSHNSTVTFAGKWLVQELKDNIRNYEEGITEYGRQKEK